MNRLNKLVLGSAVAASLLFASCSSDDDTNAIWENDGGNFVVNEGNFQSNEGSISYINKEGEVTNNLFTLVNGAPLGDIVQSLAIGSSEAAIVVNNSQKVEIVKLNTFESIATISDLSYPRYAVYTDKNTLFVTNGNMAGEVKVVNTSTGTVSKSITVGNGPEGIKLINDNIYVANGGGLLSDSTISVIDINTQTVTKTFTVGHNPKDLVEDKDGNLWVICTGIAEYNDSTYAITRDTDAELIKVNASDYSIATRITIGKASDYIDGTVEVSPNGETIYINKAGVQSLPIDATSESDLTEVIAGSFYGFSVDPISGEIYTANGGFVSANTVYKYSTSGTQQGTYTVGTATNSVVFQ